MKKLLCLLALTASCFGTTSVTGHISTLGTGSVTSGALVRFYLRGCGRNQPRITGTGAIAPQVSNGNFYFDIAADGSGNISGTLYSTRDAAGTGNGEIECGGSLTAVWYGMVILNGSVAGPEVPITAKSGATIDISNVTPNSTQPVVTAPTGDNTYARLDGGNMPFTGPLSVALGGLFDNSAMYNLSTSNVNSADINGEFHVIGGPSANAVQGLVGAVKVPSTSTEFQSQGVAGYAVNGSSSTTAAVGGYFSCHMTVPQNGGNHKCWGLNTLAYGSTGNTSTYESLEADVIVPNTTDTVIGVNVQGISTAINLPSTPPNSFGFYLSQVGFDGGGATKIPWQYGLFMDDLSALEHFIGSTGLVTAGSQPLYMAMRDGSGVRHSGSMQILSNGQLQLTSALGNGIVLQDAAFSPIFSSTTSNNPASTGLFRLADTESTCWRNHTNTGDVCLAKGSTEQLQWGGTGGFLISGPLDASSGLVSAGTLKVGASGSTISDSRELVQSSHACGSTSTCANTANQSAREIWGTITLSTGAATLTGITAYTSTSSFVCMCTDQTSAAACKAVPASTTSVTFAGTGSDVLAYRCVGN